MSIVGSTILYSTNVHISSAYARTHMGSRLIHLSQQTSHSPMPYPQTPQHRPICLARIHHTHTHTPNPVPITHKYGVSIYCACRWCLFHDIPIRVILYGYGIANKGGNFFWVGFVFFSRFELNLDHSFEGFRGGLI